MNRWRMHPAAGGAFQHSRLLHLWADGSEFRLARCWRTSQVDFFNFCQSLLTMPLAAAVQHCTSRLPPAKGHLLHMQCEMHLVISRRRRVQLNKLCQEAAVKKHRAKKPEGRVATIMEPPVQEEGHRRQNFAQAFELFEGTRLVGASNETRGIISGVFLTVGEVRDDDCDVTDEFGNFAALTFAAIARSARLAWAMTVDSSQSREFECPVVLSDLGSRFYSLGRLYVAITRVRRPERLVVVGG
jgi:hypothetical protein